MRHELSFVYDYGQLYLYDAAARSVDYLAALDDATARQASVGVGGDVVDLLMPLQWNFDAPLVVELHDAEPDADLDAWDHVVELALPLPSGRLCLEGSGGSGVCELEVPGGSYAARWAGRGFPPPGDVVPNGPTPDAYRLQLWPAAGPPAAVELKRWPGYDLLQDASA